MSTDSSDLAILRAVQQLDRKLTDALTKQTEQLTGSIQALADRHHESLLEQERRNASFADRTRVESIAEHQHTTANHVQAVTLRVSNLEKRLAELDALIRACQQDIAARAEKLLGGAAGYLITFITLLAVAIIAAIVGHQLR